MSSIQNSGLSTPKSNPPRIATSTVERPKNLKLSEMSLESSLGILSLNNVDLSNIAEVSMKNGSVEDLLNQQRQLANKTLDRVSQIGAIPSRLLHPDLKLTNSESHINLPGESTVNESDLMQTPKNTSTPRNSSLEKSDFLNQPRESIFSKIKNILNDTDISVDNAMKEFKHLAHGSEMVDVSDCSFQSANKAESRLLKDELSWRRKHDLPAPQSSSSFSATKDLPSMSIGAFFQQKSDNLAGILRVPSPTKSDEPIPLIDITTASNVDKVPAVENEKQIFQGNSFSISAIQQLISEKSTSNLLDYLCSMQNQQNADKPPRESSEIFSLPVSQNASYTTSYSDNEAVMFAAKENKENVKPAVQTQIVSVVNQPQGCQLDSPLEENRPLLSSAQSSRSSSAMTSLPNGKLPIEATVSELIWGCVKVDRCVTKQFMLRNKVEKTLRLQCSLSSYEFKIRKDNRMDSDLLNACKFVLHGHESRVLIVSFIPTKIGAAVDELVFTPLDDNLKQTRKQCVRLWGYGGYTSNEFRNAIRDNTGKHWLALGRMDNKVLMEQRFTIKNTGNLPSFAYLKVATKQLQQLSIFTNLRVEPGIFILLPNEEKIVTVTYIPTAKDCRYIKQNSNLQVMDIGKLEIITGAEANRARLKRLYWKCIEKDLTVDDLTRVLAGRVLGEVIPSDLGKFKETPSAIASLLESFKKEEMIVTIEQDPNQTLVPECPEDSVVYESLCSENTRLIDDTIMNNSCRLEPSCVVLFPPTKAEDSLFLISEATKKLRFELVISPPAGLNVSPTIGEICPGETTEFKIKLLKSPSEPHFKITVYVENDFFVAEVKVLNVKSRQNRFLD